MAAPIPNQPHHLLDGTTLPPIGFGTFPLRGQSGSEAVASALRAGYRLIDTAALYRNEADVGAGLRASGVARSEVVIQSKLPVGGYGRAGTCRAVERALGRLRLTQIDLMLIHWPFPVARVYVEQWRGLIDCQEQGLVRSIGVSNFSAKQVERIIDQSGHAPVVNQIQVNPRKVPARVRAADDGHGVLIEAYSPLGGRKSVLAEPVITNLATTLGVTPAQVVLRWLLQLGTVPLPKSANPERQKANLDVFSFELTPQQSEAVAALAR